MDTTDWSLLARYVQGTATPDEAQRMQAWLAEDPAHRELLEQAQAAWRASGDAYEAYNPDISAAWQAIVRRTGARRTDAQRNHDTPVIELPTKTSRRTWLIRAAAAIGMALGLVLLVRLLNLSGNPELTEVSTGERETKELTLADGTRVWLNERSTLRYDQALDDSVRAVYLSGEAFFDVARNERQPFRIASGDAVVRVLGTSFNVRAVPADTAVVVTVVSGVVSLADRDNGQARVVLEQGEQGVYRAADRSVTQVAAVAPNALAWRTRALDFQNRPLSEVGALLEQAYRQAVAVDSAVADLTLTAEFDDQPLEEVLEVIALTLDVRYRVQSDTIFLEEIKK